MKTIQLLLLLLILLLTLILLLLPANFEADITPKITQLHRPTKKDQTNDNRSLRNKATEKAMLFATDPGQFKVRSVKLRSSKVIKVQI